LKKRAVCRKRRYGKLLTRRVGMLTPLKRRKALSIGTIKGCLADISGADQLPPTPGSRV
jgi:hypothetical protein